MIDRGELITVDVEKATAGGRMLARHHGQVALIAGAIPGERVRARVTRVAKGVIFADLVDASDALARPACCVRRALRGQRA